MAKPLNSDQKLVLFDIDGTLISGAGTLPSFSRFSYLYKKYFNLDWPVDWQEYFGATDKAIIKGVLKKGNMSEEEIEEKLDEAFEDAYNYMVKNIGKDYKKRLIKESLELIKKLVNKKDIFLGLLTGNEENVARLKMQTVSLINYFKFGLYGHEAENRDDLARLVFKKSRKFLGINFLPKNIFIIGDTPRDVACGKVIGAKTIAVSTGKYSFSDLKKCKPSLTIKTLADLKVLKFINNN